MLAEAWQRAAPALFMRQDWLEDDAAAAVRERTQRRQRRSAIAAAGTLPANDLPVGGGASALVAVRRVDARG
jgi:hypothetical protein